MKVDVLLFLSGVLLSYLLMNANFRRMLMQSPMFVRCCARSRDSGQFFFLRLANSDASSNMPLSSAIAS